MALFIFTPYLIECGAAADNAYVQWEKVRQAGSQDIDIKCPSSRIKSIEDGVKCLEKKYASILSGLQCDSAIENKEHLIDQMCKTVLNIKYTKTRLFPKMYRQDLILAMLEYRTLSGEDYSLSQCSDRDFINSRYNRSIINFYCDLKLQNDNLNVTKSERERLDVKRDHVQYICDKSANSSRSGLQRELQEYKNLIGEEFDFSICQILKGKIKGVDY